MKKIAPFIVDGFLVVLFVLLPGIRGYANWAWHEYALLALVLVYILYLRHKLRRKT